MQKEIFKKPELAEYLNVSISTVNKMVREKSIPCFRINSLVFFDKEIIDTWILKKCDESLEQKSKGIRRLSKI